MTSATPPSLDLLGIGNAIVDVLARAEDGFLAAQGMAKGGMALIDTAAAERIYAAMGPGIEGSGGSGANTCAVAAARAFRPASSGTPSASPTRRRSTSSATPTRATPAPSPTGC